MRACCQLTHVGQVGVLRVVECFADDPLLDVALRGLDLAGIGRK